MKMKTFHVKLAVFLETDWILLRISGSDNMSQGLRFMYVLYADTE